MKSLMKRIFLGFGFAWKKGFGIGFRVSGTWKCTKGIMLTLDFANIELIGFFQYAGICKCGESPATSE